MYFESISAAMHMDGHGAYVWAAYGLTLVVLGYLVWAPMQRAKAIKRGLAAEVRRRAAATEQPSGVPHAS